MDVISLAFIPFAVRHLDAVPLPLLSDCLIVNAELTRRFAILIKDMELPALTQCSPQTDAGGYLMCYCQAKSEATGWFARKPSVNLLLAFFGPSLFEGAACQCCRGQIKSLLLGQRDSGKHAVWQRELTSCCCKSFCIYEGERWRAGAGVFQEVTS